MAAPQPLLDLTTDTTRPTVRIDGVTYSLRIQSDLGLLEYHTLNRLVPSFRDLCGRGPDMTEQESRELGAISKALCKVAVLDMPAEVDDRLGDLDRVMIFKVFTERLSPKVMQTISAIAATNARGRTSSHASNGSTAATPRRGGRSRSASSSRT